MSERIHALAQLLPGKSSLDECSVDELQHLTQRYPYFAPAQFLLLQKLNDIGSPDAGAQQRKAVLYYHDPLQFDYFVSSDKFYIDEAVLTQTGNSPEDAVFSEVDEQHPTGSIVADEQAFLQQDPPDADRTPLSEDIHPVAETVEVSEAEPSIKVLPPSETEENEVHHQEHAAIEELHAPTEETTAEGPLNESSLESEEDKQVLTEEPPAPIQQPVITTEEDIVQLPEEASDEIRSQLPVTGTNVQTVPAQKTESEALAFEPFHTVDYFASQGIKISAEEIPKDRLGKQMRSFTDWLKMMKRLPASEMARTPESPAEKTVENLASHSVEESDVVTEAMAEVWAKQGNRTKAIETYNKLSLLNPSKKAYFAAKIENLRGS